MSKVWKALASGLASVISAAVVYYGPQTGLELPDQFAEVIVGGIAAVTGYVIAYVAPKNAEA